MLSGRQCNHLQTRLSSRCKPKMKHRDHLWPLLILRDKVHSSGARATQQVIYTLVGELSVDTSPTKLVLDLTRTRHSSFQMPDFHRRQTKTKLFPSQSTMQKKLKIKVKREALWEPARPNPLMMLRTSPVNRGGRSQSFKSIKSHPSIACLRRWRYVGKIGRTKTYDTEMYLQKRIYRGIFN